MIDEADIHRHEFQVVHKSFDVTSNDTSVNPPFDEGQVNPVRRDTVTIPPGGSVTLRWVADNPGAVSGTLCISRSELMNQALFHCHVSLIFHHLVRLD